MSRENPSIISGDLPVWTRGPDLVDTSKLPPGGIWIAPGIAAFEPPAEPPAERLGGLEILLIALAGFGAGAMVGGIAWGIWKGLL